MDRTPRITQHAKKRRLVKDQAALAHRTDTPRKAAPEGARTSPGTSAYHGERGKSRPRLRQNPRSHFSCSPWFTISGLSTGPKRPPTVGPTADGGRGERYVISDRLGTSPGPPGAPSGGGGAGGSRGEPQTANSSPTEAPQRPGVAPRTRHAPLARPPGGAQATRAAFQKKGRPRQGRPHHGGRAAHGRPRPPEGGKPRAARPPNTHRAPAQGPRDGRRMSGHRGPSRPAANSFNAAGRGQPRRVQHRPAEPGRGVCLGFDADSVAERRRGNVVGVRWRSCAGPWADICLLPPCG